MKFKRIEHYDVFEEDVIIFWIDLSNPTHEMQNIAREIDGRDYNPEAFGVCVNYSFAEKELYLVTDWAGEDNCRNVFYIAYDGDKHWLKAEIPQELLDHIFKECGEIVVSVLNELGGED